jgi:hypothetical protein
MAFTRKTYTGPVKNRGTIARGGKKLADVSKEELDAFRKKAGNEDLSYKEALRKLLNADRNAKPKPEAKPEAKPESDAAKSMSESEFMDLLDRNNPASKYINKMPNNNPPAKGAKYGDNSGSKPAYSNMPNNNPPAKGAKYGDNSGSKPAYSNMPNNNPPAKGAKFDDTSLSVNQRIKKDIKDNLKGARSSNTGTDKRSVTERIKDSLGMMGGGKVKGYMGGGDIKGYGKARGAKACKMR